MNVPATERGRWDGLRKVVSFNPGHYLVGTLAAAVAIFVLLAWRGHPWMVSWLHFSGWLAVGCLLWWLAASLVASHWIYDRSDLYRWNWLGNLIEPIEPATALIAHSGFDEISLPLRSRFPGIAWQVCDFYDPDLMREPSIRRARKLYPPGPEQCRGSFDALPYPEASFGLVLFLASVHELRLPEQRIGLLREARRCLAGRGKGRIVLVEHVRDLANFLAFGPGFLHFHSPVQWRKDWTAAGLSLESSFRITPFLRGYVLRP